MNQRQITPRELWAQQQIRAADIDYRLWDQKRETLREFARISPGCIFTVDVFKGRYDFASENFAGLFGYDAYRIRTIREQGDFLEERIHPDDRVRLNSYQIEHGQFIYSLPPEERNDYQQSFQFRMLDARQQYVKVVSCQQVFQQDRQNKAWIILGMLQLSPDQTDNGEVKRVVVNRRTGEVVASGEGLLLNRLTVREREVLSLIRQGLFSKEIAERLHISIHTVHNHRKSILSKMEAGNAAEAISKIY